jgi:hypothetical protein
MCVLRIVIIVVESHAKFAVVAKIFTQPVPLILYNLLVYDNMSGDDDYDYLFKSRFIQVSRYLFPVKVYRIGCIYIYTI